MSLPSSNERKATQTCELLACALPWERLESLARAKGVTLAMLADRGYTLPPHEAGVLAAMSAALHWQHGSDRVALEAPLRPALPSAVAAAYIRRAYARRCSVEASMCASYEGGAGRMGGKLPRLHVAFADAVVAPAKSLRVKQVAAPAVLSAIATATAARARVLLFVSHTKLSSRARAVAAEAANKARIQVSYYLVSSLTFPVARHVDVPRHTLLSPSEVTELLAARRVTLTQLPRIAPNDAIVRYYGWQPGGVVCVHERYGAEDFRRIG